MIDYTASRSRNNSVSGPIFSPNSGEIRGSTLADGQRWRVSLLEDAVLNKGFINLRLTDHFALHGTDLVRRERPNARWAIQHMLGHSCRYMQETYRSDFAESGAIRAMDRRVGEVGSGFFDLGNAIALDVSAK